MPLIKHSPEFLSKQEQKRISREQEIKAAEELELKNEAEFLARLNQENSIDDLPKTIQPIISGEGRLPHHTLEDYELLFEMTRFVRKNPKLFNSFMKREINPWYKIEPIQRTLDLQIKMLKALDDGNLVAFNERFSPRLVNQRIREIDAWRTPKTKK